jgi:hypothetical protein
MAEAEEGLTEGVERVNLNDASNDGLPDGITRRNGEPPEEDRIPDVTAQLLDIKRYMKNCKNKVMFLGDGNFSFSTAVAWFRKTWENVQRSDKEIEQGRDTIAVAAVKQICFLESNSTTSDQQTPSRQLGKEPKVKESAVICDTESNDDKDERRLRKQQIEFIRETLRWPRDFMPTVVDATNLPHECSDSKADPESSCSGRALFFQCPWIMNIKVNKTEELLDEFIKSASGIQKSGDLLFLGICVHNDYFTRYGLDNTKIDEYSTQGYELLGYDNTFVTKMIKYGYRHSISLTCSTDISTKIKNYHRTLCFRRKPTEPDNGETAQAGSLDKEHFSGGC